MSLQQGKQVLVTIGNKAIAVLPDRDMDFGVVGDDEVVITGQRPDGSWGAAKVHKDDPRLASNGQGMPLAGLIPLG